MEKQELLAQAEVIRKETQDYANDANRIGKMFEDIINSIPLSVDFSQLNSLNKPESCGRYMVEEKNTGVIIGVLDIVMPWSRSSVLQRFTTSVQLSSLNAGDAIPTMEYSNLYTYDRFFNNSSSVLGGVNKGEWSKWKEAYDLNNFAKSVKWSGEIVNGITVSPNSYTGDDGTVVLVGNYTFAYKVISGGNTIYYGNWNGREGYQKNIYQSGTIGWKAGFYDYLLYVSPTSVWMKKSDSELVNISSEGSGEGSNALLLGDINSLTDSSTSSQIATALNNKTLAELQDAVRNGASIQFVGDYGVVDIIYKSQSTGQLVFGFIYTDEPACAPYMSKIIALEYTNGNWTCKVREDVDLSSGSDSTKEQVLKIEARRNNDSDVIEFRINKYVENGHIILKRKKRCGGRINHKEDMGGTWDNPTGIRKSSTSKYANRSLYASCLKGAINYDKTFFPVTQDMVGKWVELPHNFFDDLYTMEEYVDSESKKTYTRGHIHGRYSRTMLSTKNTVGLAHVKLGLQYAVLNPEFTIQGKGTAKPILMESNIVPLKGRMWIDGYDGGNILEFAVSPD